MTDSTTKDNNNNNDTVWTYTPSFPFAVLATVLYGLAFIYITYRTVIRYKTWYFLCVVVGAAIEAVGYAVRCVSIKNQGDVVRLSFFF
jgi:uncharacterized membrane protein